MARLPGRACRWPGCPEIVRGESIYCDKHKTQGREQWDKSHDAKRGSARERGYDTQWDKFRAWFLQRPGNQYCHRCLELEGEFVKAEVVHHIEPISERPDLRLVASNCLPLCYQCHAEVHREGSQESIGVSPRDRGGESTSCASRFCDSKGGA